MSPARPGADRGEVIIGSLCVVDFSTRDDFGEDQRLCL